MQKINPPLNPFPNESWFSCVCFTLHFKKMWEKEKSLVTSNFSFSHNVYYPFGKFAAIFIKFEIVLCQVWKSKKFVVWERGKDDPACLVQYSQTCQYHVCPPCTSNLCNRSFFFVILYYDIQTFQDGVKMSIDKTMFFPTLSSLLDHYYHNDLPKSDYKVKLKRGCFNR